MNAVGRLTWRARVVMMVRQMLLLLLKEALSRHTPGAGPGLSQAELTRPPGLFSRRGTEPRNSRAPPASLGPDPVASSIWRPTEP